MTLSRREDKKKIMAPSKKWCHTSFMTNVRNSIKQPFNLPWKVGDLVYWSHGKDQLRLITKIKKLEAGSVIMFRIDFFCFQKDTSQNYSSFFYVNEKTIKSYEMF